MKLNPDCVRAILLCVESSPNPDGLFLFVFSDKTGFLDGPSIDDPCLSVNSRNELTSFSEDEIRYHIKQCELSGLIGAVSNLYSCECLVDDLTPLGHEFIAQIRQASNWNKIKSHAAKIGCTSLGVLINIAQGYISSLIIK